MTGEIARGPVLSGFLLEHFWWGSVFLINIPAMVLRVRLCAWASNTYRMAMAIPAGIPDEASALARETLAGATVGSAQLPDELSGRPVDDRPAVVGSAPTTPWSL
jgi:MFS family permease